MKNTNPLKKIKNIEAIKLDEIIEVTAAEYKVIMVDYKGICAGRVEDGKYYIKIWLKAYKLNILEFINDGRE